MTVDRRSDRGVRKQIADELRARIARGDIKPGERLPSEEQLRQEFDMVSRPTVSGAITALRHEGLVSTTKTGSYVRPVLKKDVVKVQSGVHVDSRMPTEPERTARDIEEGVALFVLSDRDETYPIDRHTIVLECE